VPLTYKFAKESRVQIFRNERTRSTPLDAKLLFWGVLHRFVATRKSMQNLLNSHHLHTSLLNRVASDRFITARMLMQNCKKVASEFFVMNAPNPLLWTQTHVLGRFGPFRFRTKVAAKLAELAPLTHKFAKRSRVIMFRNERTRYTLMDPKLIFRGVSDRFVTAQKSMQNRSYWYHYRTSSQNNVASEFFATNAPDPLHLSQNLCFRGISDRFVIARKLMQNLPN
jgi:hypothetical protein